MFNSSKIPDKCVSNALLNISPIDGRYFNKTISLIKYFNEYALIYYRLYVEVKWLITMSEKLPNYNKLSNDSIKFLYNKLEKFTVEDAIEIKNIEKDTNHDVKAVEYFLRDMIVSSNFTDLHDNITLIHFACTSEDINNLAYGMMIKNALESIIMKKHAKLFSKLQNIAIEYANIPMLAHTHGQAATPTTLGKEFKVYEHRLELILRTLSSTMFGKMNGASGNFNAHIAAYPNLNWNEISRTFVEELDLSYNYCTTQVENQDRISEVLFNIVRINNILIDLCQDIWLYIHKGYLKQKTIATETGSSTMPHKVNPIDFENAEGNLKLANSLMLTLANNLPISRMQRDLTGSTQIRNIGVAFAQSMIAYKSLTKGLNKICPDLVNIEDDLGSNWAILAEPIQVIMKSYGIKDAYEQLKDLTRGKDYIHESDIKEFIQNLKVSNDVKYKLNALTPFNYVGLAKEIADNR